MPATPIPAGYASFIDVTGLGLAVITGNHVRNVAQLIAGFDPGRHVSDGNVAYCSPTGLGWNAANIGVGKLLAPQLGWRYIVEDGDPASATYGQVLNTCPLAVTLGSGQSVPPTPTGGKWVAGTHVANLTLPTGSSTSFVSGWIRLTTGADASPGPNWLAVQTTVSAL